MKIKYLAIILAVMPCIAFAASKGARSTGARGEQRASVAMNGAKGVKAAAQKKSAVTTGNKKTPTNTKFSEVIEEVEEIDDETTAVEEVSVANNKTAKLDATECRDAYRECMDDFCLLDESEGERCSCSDNIKHSKKLIQEIQKIQQEAETLYTEGVEKERLGAKAKLIFGTSENAKKRSRATGIDFADWVSGGTNASLAADDEIGDNLYSMAAEACEDVLARCDKKIANKEEQLYLREVTKNCKAFDAYLAEQKGAAESNKRTAQAAVRSAKLEMLDTTNKYNRGECLLAYRSCIADKGGCGVNFENCLDASLLSRRAHACENVLDQCMAARDYVLEDWADESKMILADAAKFSDKYMRETCNAKTRNCLEEGCSTSSNVMCLNNINVAAGICPIIDECNDKIPGFKAGWQDLLAELRTDFCQNDVTKCLQDKCGVNYDAPQCTGKSTSDIVALCPKSRFASCKNEPQFNILVASVLLNMNYRMLENCQNYYADLLGKTCGLDMSCLPGSSVVSSFTKYQKDTSELEERVKQEAISAVDKFFERFEGEQTVAACKSAQQPTGRKSLKDSIFVATKQAAEFKAQARYLADLETKRIELLRKENVETAKADCYERYKVESRPDQKGSYTYIKSVSFEPSMRNCHVCRIQHVCQVGGESKSTGALKGAAGGIGAGASVGAGLGPWGAAIGAVVGGIGGGILGANSSNEEEFCQDIEACEDINTGDSIGEVK